MAIESLRDIIRASASAFEGGGVWLGDSTPASGLYRHWLTTANVYSISDDGVTWFQVNDGNEGADWGDITNKPATFVSRYYGASAPDPNLYDEWVPPSTGRVRRHDGEAWWEEPGVAGPAGPAGPAGATGSTGSGGPTSVTLSGDQAFSATTIADVTNMPTLTLAANTDYQIELIGSFTSAATTTGIGLCLNVGGTVTEITGQVIHPTSATANGTTSQEANNAVTGATSGVRATGVNIPITGRWFVRMGGTGGTAQLRCRSEIASSAVTLRAGMRLRAFVL